MDLLVETSEQVFVYVPQIQLNKNVFSQFTALQRAHVNFADFRPKFTGVF